MVSYIHLPVNAIVQLPHHLTRYSQGQETFWHPLLIVKPATMTQCSNHHPTGDDPTYNPSPVQELSLLTQFSSITTLQSLVSEKQCKAA